MHADQPFYSASLRRPSSGPRVSMRSSFAVRLASTLLTGLLTFAAPGFSGSGDSRGETADTTSGPDTPFQRSGLETVICRAHTSFLTCGAVDRDSGHDVR
jgi:hypothetical protein